MIDAEMYGMMPRPKMQRVRLRLPPENMRHEAEHLARARRLRLLHLLGQLRLVDIGSGT